MIDPRNWGISLLAAAFCVGAATGALAQNYPNHTITIVVANGTGLPEDLSARIIAPEMSRMLGVPVVVVNKPGAGTIIGAQYVATQQPADGYTIASLSMNSLLLLPVIYKNVPFDPVRDLPAFADIFSGRTVLATSSQNPYKTVGDFIAAAKANPGKLNYGSSAPTSRLLQAILLQANHLNLVFVPYSNQADQLVATMGGEVQIGMFDEGVVLSTGGKLRILAETGYTRSPKAPDVPTFSELGLPNIVGADFSFNIRRGTPPAIVNKLHDTVAKILQEPAIRAQLEKLSYNVDAPIAVAALDQRMATQSAEFKQTAKAIGLQPQ